MRRLATGLAALLFVFADVSAAESLGRLFFDTEQRRMLDEMREADTEPEIRAPIVGAAPVAPVVDVISFDGKVERSGGASTMWVNGRPVFTGNSTVEGIRLQPSRGTSGETIFVLPPSDVGMTDFSLKVGEKVSVQNGRKFDAYEVRPGEDAESVLGEDARPESDKDAPSSEAPGSGAAEKMPGS